MPALPAPPRPGRGDEIEAFLTQPVPTAVEARRPQLTPVLPKQTLVSHALTIDLEDWHELMLRRLTGVVGPVSQTVKTCTHRLLDLLDARETRATFFVVGAVAAAHPDLIREIAGRGHEIGSHTNRHVPIPQQTRAEFREELDRTVKHLQDLTGQPVLGFRAPIFSVGSVSHWCFEVLGELGFAYDSSVFPIGTARYGIGDCPRTPFIIDTPWGPIVEFPIASWVVRGKRVAVGGGSYFRFLPVALLRRAFQDLEQQHHPAVIYVHPYEFHDGWLEVGWRKPKAVYLKYLLLHNFATSRVAARLSVLLKEHRFGTLRQLYEGYA
jgi:polysaccharide deacetylase family protein (PEP-CTERM system associated)